MQTDSLAEALELEHREIDAGIEAFTAAPGDRAPLTRALDALRRHIYLEEEFLFPLLREHDPALSAPVFVMLREHAQMWPILDALGHAAESGGADTDELVKQLNVQLLHHNLKEERILYPRADALQSAAVDRLHEFLETRALPEGWVCIKARTDAGDAPAGAE